MGDRKRRRAKFFDMHPVCCFCAGRRLATTEDHQPGRVFFSGRVWPEGFVFPACEACNVASAESEELMALLIHGEAASSDRSRYQQVLQSVRDKYPDLIASLLPSSANEVRSILKKKGIAKPNGTAFAELPIVKLDGAFWYKHFSMFSRKLLLALHYQTFAKPLSEDGAIWSFHHTNVDAAAGNFPKELIENAENYVAPSRNRRLLDGQFSLRWSAVPNTSAALYCMQFHNVFAVSGVTTEEVEAFGTGNKPDRMGPFHCT